MNRSSPSSFHGLLAPQLRAYLDFKQKLGYTSFRFPYLARDLDHYLVFRDIASAHDIDENLVAHWVHCLPNLHPGSKNNRLKFARGFLRYLLRLGLIRHNPALRIPYLKAKSAKPYIYPLQEIHRILEEARRFQSRYHGRLLGCTLETMIFLIYACGLRLGEALRLNLRDVDFEHNTLALWNTKFHKERLVPFSPAVADKLRAYLLERRKYFPKQAPTDPFFRHSRSNYRRPIEARYRHGIIESHFRRLLSRCGLARHGDRRAPRIHDLRHTFAVHRLYKWYQEGHDLLNKLPLLSTYMGHTHIEHTQVYLTISLALLREGDRRFQAGFGDVAERALKRAFKTL